MSEEDVEVSRVKPAKPPAGLSEESAGRWVALHETHPEWAVHEEIALLEALRSMDRGNDLYAKGDVGGAVKCWVLASRLFKTIKYPTDAAPRRPGRPADENWSAMRRGRRAS